MDGERLGFLLESRTGDEITADDEEGADLAEVNSSVL